jgi:putative aminopeptidase FrvX
MLANCSLVLIAALLFFLLFSPSFSQSTQSESGGIVISSESQLLEDITLAPCKNQSRLSAVESLFEKLGAPPAELAIEKLGGVENLTLKVAGKSSEIILVGAHYDKVQNGCGAVDNWSGIVAIGHIYHSLKNLHLNKTIIFVAFGREEEGLLGSKAMAKRKDPDFAVLRDGKYR